MAWARSIKIRDLITEQEDAASLIRFADGITERLKNTTAPLERIAKGRAMIEMDPELALVVLSSGLGQVYDWADANMIWLS